MHYYIDGYNLLFRLLQTGDDLKNKRNRLIYDLQTKINFLNLDVTLVFDSHYQKDKGTRSHILSMEIIFTDPGETADEFILKQLKETPSQQTVITSDKKLAWLCRRRLAKTENVETFITNLNRRYKNKIDQKSIQNQKSLKTTLSPILKPPALSTPNSAPHSSIPAEECFDYYFEIFEKLSQDVPAKKEKSNKKPSKNKRSPQNNIKTNNTPTDMQRWQNAFERDVKLDNPS